MKTFSIKYLSKITGVNNTHVLKTLFIPSESFKVNGKIYKVIKITNDYIVTHDYTKQS